MTGVQWADTYRMATERVAGILRSGRDVVQDNVMGFARAREEFPQLATGCGAETCLIYLDVPAEELGRRRLENLASQGRPDVLPEILFTAAERGESTHGERDSLR